MFQVPGWSVTATLKPQTGPVTIPSLPAEIAKGAENGKKRKRKQQEGSDTKAVAASNKDGTGMKSTEVNVGGQDGPAKKQRKEKLSNMDTTSKEPATNAIKESAHVAKTARESASLQTIKTETTSGEQTSKKRKRARRGKAKDEAPATEDAHTISAAETGSRTEKSNKKDETKAPIKIAATNSASKPKTSQRSSSTDPNIEAELPKKPVPLESATKLTPLQASMRAKLASARFRHLNETLYTSASNKALDLFKKNPEMFDEYHSGFRQQVDVWPENPVDSYLADIKRRGAIKSSDKSVLKVLPRTHGTCTIADLGCGDAKLAEQLQKSQQSLQVKVLSYDLHSPSPHVVRADIANLPLEDGSVNVAIFCLALMGTNWPDFIDEAYRILHWKGELWIAEIKSRFGRVEGKKKGAVVEHSVGNRKKKPRAKMSEAEKRKEDNARKADDDTLAVEVDGVDVSSNHPGGDETDVNIFIKVLLSRGFVLDGDEKEAVERGNKMFVKLRFLKASQPTKGKNVKKGTETWKPKGKKFLDADAADVDEDKVLKPCVYKLR